MYTNSKLAKSVRLAIAFGAASASALTANVAVAQEEEDVDTSSIEIEPGDYFLLCSDGLYGKVSDTDISKIVQKHSLGAVPILVNLANERGGEDNITVIVVKVESKQ